MFRHFYVIIREFYICAFLSYINLTVDIPNVINITMTNQKYVKHISVY